MVWVTAFWAVTLIFSCAEKNTFSARKIEKLLANLDANIVAPEQIGFRSDTSAFICQVTAYAQQLPSNSLGLDISPELIPEFSIPEGYSGIILIGPEHSDFQIELVPSYTGKIRIIASSYLDTEFIDEKRGGYCIAAEKAKFKIDRHDGYFTMAVVSANSN